MIYQKKGKQQKCASSVTTPFWTPQDQLIIDKDHVPNFFLKYCLVYQLIYSFMLLTLTNYYSQCFLFTDNLYI